jgi:hypothetical protein
MQRKFVLLVLFASVSVLAIPALNAETLSITPGKWRMETVTTSSMAPQPQTETEIECIEETGWDPVKDLADGGDCQLSNVNQTSTSFSANMSCQMAPGMPPMTGSMEYTTSGTTMSGKYSAKMGQYAMQGTSTGERLGDYD